MNYKNITAVLILLVSLCSFNACDDTEEDYQYKLTVESYYTGFSGYYYINGSYEGAFEGILDYTDALGNNHYYYEKELEAFSSIKIYAYKTDENASVTISVWDDGKEVATETSGALDIDDDGSEYVTTVGPLYYEPGSE